MKRGGTFTGINIQYPISQLIVSGEKTIETRTYPIPPKFIGKNLALVETPGKSSGFKSRIIAIIKFGPSFKYSSKKEFYLDSARHCVTPTSTWAWKQETPKWGWPILECHPLKKTSIINCRLGIKYTNDLILETF